MDEPPTDPSGAHAPGGPFVVGVLIPSPVPHLDRVFDYAVPEALAERVALGVRVRVRFSGRLRTGFVVAVKTGSDFDLLPLTDVKGPPVLTPALASLTKMIAVRYVGNWGDVITAAVPPRHARAERSVCDSEGRLPAPLAVRPCRTPGAAAVPTASEASAGAPAGVTRDPIPAAAPAPAVPAAAPAMWPEWQQLCMALESSPGPKAEPATNHEGDAGGASSDHRSGALGSKRIVRAALTVPWGWDAEPLLAQAAAAVLAGGRRVLVVVPDDADVQVACSALAALDPAPRVATLTSTTGPHARYGAYLRAISGQVEVVIGTRSAALVPVPDLGLIWLWRDADPSMPDPQAPYWHPREVTGLRSVTEEVPWIAAGRSRTTEVQRLVEVDWAREVSPPRAAWRAGGPTVRAVGEGDLARDAAAYAARLPKVAFEVARAGLAAGPVLVQVPRRGYLPAVACATCREIARCGTCGGPLRLPGRVRAPQCGWCAAVATAWVCPECAGTRLRAVGIGSARTAEELGKAFPGVAVLSSDAEAGVRAEVADVDSLVVATPGAEPRVTGGRYRAALLLDGDVMLAVPRLRAAEDAMARWCDAASLVRGDGQVMLAAAGHSGPAQAMVRADPVGWASRELAERVATGLPPAVRMIALDGTEAAVGELLAQAAQELGVLSLGAVGPMPMAPGIGGTGGSAGVSAGRGSGGSGTGGDSGPHGGGSSGVEAGPPVQRWLLRIDYARGLRLAEALAAVQRERSRLRRPVVTIRVDPHDID